MAMDGEIAQLTLTSLKLLAENAGFAALPHARQMYIAGNIVTMCFKQAIQITEAGTVEDRASPMFKMAYDKLLKGMIGDLDAIINEYIGGNTMEEETSRQIFGIWEALYTNADFAKMPIRWQIRVAEIIEKSCFNYTLKVCDEQNIPAIWSSEAFMMIYNNTLYNLRVHLDANSTAFSPNFNQWLMTASKIYGLIGEDEGNVVADHLKITRLSNIAGISDIDKCMEKNKKHLDEIDMRSNIKIEEKFSDLYFCKRCRSKKCKSVTLQLRSLDEGSSEKVTCYACGFDWVIF